MIISMFDCQIPTMVQATERENLSRILCVTNRAIAAKAAGIADADSAEGRMAFLAQVHRVTSLHPRAVILREKDLSPEEYQELASQVLPVCNAEGVPCILHAFPEVARALQVSALHLPLPALRRLEAETRQRFHVLGTSCHSVADVREAQAIGCTYVTLGHIYATDCKRGVPPRGLGVLREAVQAATVPVYAIGGVTRARLAEVLATGVAGAAVMSGFMRGTFPMENC